jgi:hypothetical protein
LSDWWQDEMKSKIIDAITHHIILLGLGGCNIVSRLPT